MPTPPIPLPIPVPDSLARNLGRRIVENGDPIRTPNLNDVPGVSSTLGSIPDVKGLPSWAVDRVKALGLSWAVFSVGTSLVIIGIIILVLIYKPSAAKVVDVAKTTL